MAKKPKVDDPATPDVDESLELDGGADDVTDSDGDVVAPETHVCLEGSYVKVKEPRPRTVQHGGSNYEHTHEDESGVWHYRRM